MTSLCRQSLCAASSSTVCKAFSGGCSTSSKAMPLRGSFMQQCRLSSSQLSSPLQPRNLSSTGGAVAQQQQQQQPSSPSSSSGASSVACHGFDPKGNKGGGSVAAGFNSAYLVIFGIFGALMLLRNPYIFAALSIATILPQNSSVTSLNQLVIIFYESGLFMNFAEAVSCVRLVTWLSIICTLVSFAIFQ